VRLIFLHIPKTGGTTFREASAEAFGEERTVRLYGADAATTSPLAQEHFFSGRDTDPYKERAADLADAMKADGTDFLTTHWGAAFLDLYPGERFVAIVREPVSRYLSNYDHERRNGRVESFEAYLEDERFHNQQAAHFGEKAPADLGVVGLTERLADTIRLVNAAFGLDLPSVPKTRNRTHFWRKSDRAALLDRYEEAIRLRNGEDVALYDEARRLFEEKAGG